MSPKGECSKISAAVNSMIGAQSGSIGRGTGGLESEKESGTLESQAARWIILVFGSIAVETAAPEAVFNHLSSVGAVVSELRVGADAGTTSGVLFGGRARSYPLRQCGAPGCGSNPSKIKSPRMSAV